MTALATSPKTLVGQSIANGRYKVRSILGQGSMGYVFRAFDERLETDVVIKVPTAAKLELPEYHRRFLQESRFLVKLSHPHIVKILDIGDHENVPFFVMQFVDGGSLRDRAPREKRGEVSTGHPLPLESLADWLMPVAKALDFMHQQGFLHRDVKPANILFDQHGHAYLSDFGLSKLVLENSETDSEMTSAGAVIGTPNYVAPEIVLAKTYDGRADQYSLAMTVYEILTGVLPFEGASGSATFVNLTTQRTPEPTKFNPDVSEDLSKRVLKGLSKAAANRYGSCVELAEAILSAVFADRSSANWGQASGQSAVTPRPSLNRVPEKTRTTKPEPKLPPAPPPQKKAATSTNRSVATKRAASYRPGMIRRYVIAGKRKGKPCEVPCPACKKIVKFPRSYAGKRGTCIKCDERLQVSDDLKTLLWLKIEEFTPDELDNASESQVVGSGVNDSEFNLILGERLFGWRLTTQQTLWLTVGLFVFLLGVMFYFSRESAKVPEKTKKQVMEVSQIDR